MDYINPTSLYWKEKSYNPFHTKSPQKHNLAVIAVRKSQENISKLHKTNFFAPPLSLCTDNGLMIAYAGGLRYIYGDYDDLDLAPKTRWPLDPENQMTIGFGKKGRKV